MIDELQIDEAGGRLTLLTTAGASHQLSHAALRRACRCAPCEAGRRLGYPPDVTEDVRIVRWEMQGLQAIRFFFSDGHDRGIYPFRYLVELVRPDVVNHDKAA